MLPYCCCCCCCYSYTNSITEKLSNPAGVSSSEILAWRATQLCRNLGQLNYAHWSPFPRRCWCGFWRQSRRAEVINNWLSECVQLHYSASQMAETPMRENTEYVGSCLPPFQKYIVLKSCQVDAITLLIFPLEDIS